MAGASEGVGASVARLLGARGVNVVLVARRPEPLREVAATVGTQTRTVAMDLGRPDADADLAARRLAVRIDAAPAGGRARDPGQFVPEGLSAMMWCVVATTGNSTRDEVGDVFVRYATGIDRREWALLRTCFTDDCDADYGEIGHWHSGDEITDWMARTHDPLGPTMHRITNITVSVEGEHATARSYVHAVLTTEDRATTIHAYGWYDDELVAATDGWRISRRHFTSVTTELRTP